MVDAKKIKTRKLRKGTKDLVDTGLDEGTRIKEKNDILKKKKVKSKKIRMSFSKVEEQKMDKAIERDDNMSVMLIVIVLVLCFIVGISLGYLLYRIAINGVI